MRKILHFLLFTSCTLFTGSLRAQTYPVQGNAFLIPPYSLRLSDYATSTSERLAVNVLLTDVTRAELRVRFRLHIEGPTISVDTKPEYIGSAIVLQGGISLRLTNLDLSEYFSFRNLNFTGISEREFLQKGTLPEGLYRICFDVLEYNRGVKIAQSICAQAFLALNAPPIINLPRQGETLRAQMPQNVIMQWTPRHTGSPNSAFNTQYEIRVVEVWPSDRNPNDAILTQPSIYETTTTNTTLIYGPDATQLEPGRTYALRVRAVPMGEADQLDLFTNNGYSETVSFVYGQTCKPPAAVTGKVTGPHTSTLDWLQDNNHTAYKIHLRKQGSHDWRLHRSNITTIDLKDLDANTNYEYEVGAVCGDFESPYSALGTLKTMEAQTPLYDCGAKPKGQLNTNQEPLPELKVGDKVHTLTVEVTITKVTGGNGTFSGEAEARLKIFNKALMSLVFKDIRVNKDYWLIGGYFEAVNGGVELPKAVEEGLDVLGDVLDESKGGGTSNDYKTSPPDVNTFVAQETITIPDGIQTIIKDERTGIVTVTDTKGVKHDLPRGKDVAVADENGRGALVNKNGQITNTTAEQAKAAGKREYGFSVVFEKAPESKAGFDKYDGKTTALKNTYQKIEEYIVPWKAISTGTDVVKGNLSIGTAKDLIFEQEGARLTYNEFTDILTVNSVPAGSTAQVIVKEKTGDKEKIRGKLNIAGYAPISKTVHIVPVNNATCTISEADLKTYLDNVYGQALVSWQVDKKNKIDVSFTGDFDDGGSGLLSTYTGDMRKVINAYGSMEPEHYYIFLIERGKTKTGYMPRGKQAGFVFLNNQSGEDIKHTIAHELGHGAFTLRHPFAEYPTVTEKSTDNLMDYAGGNHLYKWQWDQIHNPVAVIGLFEDDDEGEYIGQIVKCLSAAAIDVTMNYAFKWLELNFLDDDLTNNYGILEFEKIWKATDKWEMLSSATISCATSVIPFPSTKTKLIGVMTASFGDGAIELIGDVEKQYKALPEALSFIEKIEKVNWLQSFRKAGIQSLITGISAGVVIYASDHPKFKNFAGKIKKLSYEQIEKLLKQSGFSSEAIEKFCNRFGVKRITNVGNLFNLSAFKNLAARIPSGSKLTNIKKSEFLTHGYKVKPESSGLKAKIDDIIANGDNLGRKTEGIVDDIMSQNGYTKLDGKYGSNNGYDGVYIKGDINNPTEIIIIESKQFKYTNGVADDVIEHSGVILNPNYEPTGLPAQMSDGWIEYVRTKLAKAGKTDIAQMLFLNKQKITKYVSAVDKTQGEINFLKLGAY